MTITRPVNTKTAKPMLEVLGKVPKEPEHSWAEEKLLEEIQELWGDIWNLSAISQKIHTLKGLIMLREPIVKESKFLRDTMSLFKVAYEPYTFSKEHRPFTLGEVYPFMCESTFFWCSDEYKQRNLKEFDGSEVELWEYIMNNTL